MQETVQITSINEETGTMTCSCVGDSARFYKIAYVPSRSFVIGDIIVVEPITKSWAIPINKESTENVP